MNVALLCVIFIINETKSFYVDNTSFHKDVERKMVLLRKLQNLQEYDSRNVAQTPSWNEILADVLVKRIFPFHKQNNETENITNVDDEKSIWVGCISFALKIYKNYLYDKLRYDGDTRNDAAVEIPESVNDTSDNPNDDVEILEPAYHGKLCDNCDIKTEIESNIGDCGEGSVKDADGNCTSKSSQFILSIPSQCPVGYRRDWLGYCRVLL
ncbi:uncharacterized protein LOC125067302 [Vanessa atalanta]|uniref:uncharacterized protein LOC125067302 n=1 Tax=Vanessa atalanta TaxID=42275 RepID=UPI001FCCFF8F|nr:uncharacterized protein LOC125067302 [Vanessa atalanta]